MPLTESTQKNFINELMIEEATLLFSISTSSSSHLTLSFSLKNLIMTINFLVTCQHCFKFNQHIIHVLLCRAIYISYANNFISFLCIKRHVMKKILFKYSGIVEEMEVNYVSSEDF